MSASTPDQTEHEDAPYRSFWHAGFEGADHVNGGGCALDMTVSSGHLARVDEDYARLAQFGIRTARESVGWRGAETRTGFDFDSVRIRARAARKAGVQILWTAMHYGWPRDLDLFSPDLVTRFERFAHALASCLREFATDAPLVITPINEISFLSWAVCETGLIHPYRGGLEARAHELKCNIVRAAIAGCDAIRAEIPDVRFLHVDPVVHIVAPLDRPELVAAAHAQTLAQFEAWDMLAGRVEPGLGGSDACLDLVGVNYYPNNQWELVSKNRLWWHLRDPRRRPFSDLLLELCARYERPVTIAETSHLGAGKARWIADVAEHIRDAQQRGCMIEGVCLYPAVDRPDWENPSRWHDSGLWHVDVIDPSRSRALDRSYAAAVLAAQQRVTPAAAERTTQAHPSKRKSLMHTLIVFSHLRWDFVYQRPQQILSRLASHWRILFVEEPLFTDGEAIAEILDPAFNVRVLRPHTPIARSGFDDAQVETISRMLAEELIADSAEEYSVWFYTPMALPLLKGLSPAAIVYDCMDELSAFDHAPAQLVAREATLLAIANLVFTGGPSLNERKRRQRADAYCFPSSVDSAHFARARNSEISHALVDALPRPRLGFYGVIDERFDSALLARVAAARPEWQWIIVGPIVKIDPATLPRSANIHYLPQQAYAELPALIAGWDVCVLPFAINAATRFISPTKTLEYLAAGKPVVSTPIADVERLYGAVVATPATDEAFIAACESALAETPADRAQRERAAARLVEATSWDKTAAQMQALLQVAEREGLGTLARHHVSSPRVVRLANTKSAAATHTAPCLILGAGPTGLSAAWHFGAGATLIERNQTVGGGCRSTEVGGFQFDYAGHIMFSRDPHVHEMYAMLLGDNVHWQEREAWIYSHGVHTRYPFQGCLYGLPAPVLKECLLGAIEARFGPLDADAEGAIAAAGEEAPAAERDDCCGDGVIGSIAAAQAPLRAIAAAHAPESENFEAFIHRVWGAGVARHFAIPYNRKLWGLPLSEMETSWLGGRVPLPDLAQMIDGALQPVTRPMGPNARFGYPLRGGFQSLMEGFLPHLRGPLRLGCEVRTIDPYAKTVTFDDGSELAYEHLISTIALPALVRALGAFAPPPVHAAAAALRHVSVRCVNLGIGRENLTDKHWIYYPEDTVFHRIFVQGNASPHCNPAGGFGLTCEITYSPDKPLREDGDALTRRCIEDCIRVGLIDASDRVLVSEQVDIPIAYVVYDHTRKQHVECIREWLGQHDIHLAGRYSEWEYYNSDHAFIAGKRAAEEVHAALEAAERAQERPAEPERKSMRP